MNKLAYELGQKVAEEYIKEAFGPQGSADLGGAMFGPFGAAMGAGAGAGEGNRGSAFLGSTLGHVAGAGVGAGAGYGLGKLLKNVRLPGFLGQIGAPLIGGALGMGVGSQVGQDIGGYLGARR